MIAHFQKYLEYMWNVVLNGQGWEGGKAYSVQGTLLGAKTSPSSRRPRDWIHPEKVQDGNKCGFGVMMGNSRCLLFLLKKGD